VALAEMAIASGIGATVGELNDCPVAEVFFGEDQGRYVLTVSHDNLDAALEAAAAAGVFMPFIGETGGAQLKLGDADAISLAQLRAAHESWFPAFMGV
jgi:phosphoribosylformylglycinamidine synthase